MSEPFRILVVCVGNVCRSPLAERLLRRRFTVLGESDVVHVSSAGVRAVVGAPMDAHAALELERLGGSADGFVARQLTPAMVREADLVLTATRSLRSRVLEEVPTALRRTFTLRELGALSAGLTVAGEDLVAAAAGRRWAAPVDSMDLADPIGAGARRHREVADQIRDAVDAVSVRWAGQALSR